MKVTRIAVLLTFFCLPVFAGIFTGSGRPMAMRELRKANVLLARGNVSEESGEYEEARAFYEEALATYREVQSRYPKVESGLIRFRMDNCARKIAALPAVAGNLPEEEGQKETEEPPGEPVGNDFDAADDGSGDSGARPEPTDGETEIERPETDSASERSGEDIERIGLQLRVLKARRLFPQAEDMLSEGLKAYPGNRRLILWMAGLKIERRFYEEASAVLKTMPDATDDEAALLLEAAAAVGLGKEFEALSALDRAIQVNPRSSRAYMNLAHLRYRMNPENNRAEAATYYRQALRLGAPTDESFESKLGLSARRE